MNNRLYKALSSFMILVLSLVLMQPTRSAQALASELFISEYIEGSSLNKAVEIYNGTGASATLSEALVKRLGLFGFVRILLLFICRFLLRFCRSLFGWLLLFRCLCRILLGT